MTIRYLLLAAFALAASNQATAEVQPTDVYYQMQQLAADLGLVRAEMGVAKMDSNSISVSKAQPREVYFQALTLFRKSNRLLLEQVRERQPEPEAPTGKITPAHVMNVVQQSHAMILRVKKYLSIPESSIPSLDETAREPTDVFRLIVAQNRTVNSLLQQRLGPADVYQQITYGVGITSAILTTFGIEPRLGVEPDYVRRKTPADVYKRLVQLHKTIQLVIELAGGKCLTIADSELARPDVIPGDVYDMAHLVIAQLRYLYDARPAAPPYQKDYYPGDRLTSHVFQRAGRLESQIEMLFEHTQNNPGWLN